MPKGLLYLLIRHIAGSWRFRLKRLKQPKYLVGMLAIVGYFYLLFVGSWSSSVARKVVTQPELAGLLVSVFLTFQFGLIWLLAGRFTGIGFSEAETEILFAAPVTRQALIRYRMLKSQPGILFSAIFLVAILSMSWKFSSPLLSFVAVFLLLNIIQAFQLLTTVLHGFWQGKWWSGLIKVGFLALLLLPFYFSTPLPQSPKGLVGSLLLWAQTASLQSQALAGHVWVGQFVVTSSWFEWLPRFAACLLAFLLLYKFIVWSNVGFEEKEMMQARKRASSLRAFRQGRAAVVRDRPVKASLFPIAWTGPPWRAIAWKNMTALFRHVPRGFLFAVLYIVFVGVMFMVFSGSSVQPSLASAVILAVIALFLTFMGSSMMKEDLRSDLEKIEILRALPIPSDEIIRGEIFGASFVMMGLIVALLGGSATLLTMGDGFGLKFHQIWLAAGLMSCLLSGVILLSFTIENSLAMLFPAWVLPDEESAQHSVSMDQMGRSIVLVIARFALLSLLLIPPGLWMFLTAQGAIVLRNTGIMAISATGFAVIAWGETEIIILWLAKAFDNYDGV